MNMVDQKGLTALDTVKDMPSQKSREIAALIQGEDSMCKRRVIPLIPCSSVAISFSFFHFSAHMTGKPPDIDLPPPPIPPPQESPSPRKKGKIYQMSSIQNVGSDLVATVQTGNTDTTKRLHCSATNCVCLPEHLCVFWVI